MDAASTLPVLQWLHDNRIEGCSTRAMDNAASRNQFDMLLFLQQHYPGIECGSEAAGSAVARGHFEMFFWLCVNCPDQVNLERLRAHRGDHVWAQILDLVDPHDDTDEREATTRVEEQVTLYAAEGEETTFVEASIEVSAKEEVRGGQTQAEPEAELATEQPTETAGEQPPVKTDVPLASETQM
ncbi:hypothetical protein PybrP1_008568 [[Pythium] brassicae (nom. inval.)]|nr:hypothetical protein PybrP1_008568 [[Pythium] brassicae (nom. inval.)]